MRAVRSVPPPGVKGTMMRIGWLGYAAVCDQAAADIVHAPRATSSVATRCIMDLLRHGRGARFRSNVHSNGEILTSYAAGVQSIIVWTNDAKTLSTERACQRIWATGSFDNGQQPAVQSLPAA